MSWEIQYQCGVRSDHTGRKYRILLNSFGRQDRLYVQDTDAPKGYTVPEPVVAKPKVAFKRGPVLRGKRLHVARYRRVGEQDVHEAIVPNDCQYDTQDKLSNYLMISPDLGRTWKVLGKLHYDYHVQYHIDEEVK